MKLIRTLTAILILTIVLCSCNKKEFTVTPIGNLGIGGHPTEFLDIRDPILAIIKYDEQDTLYIYFETFEEPLSIDLDIPITKIVCKQIEETEE